MTFSIVARDPQTGELGVAVQSKFLAVGAVVPWANTSYGPRGFNSPAGLQTPFPGLYLGEKADEAL